jgi:tyrosyl-tRNA synthetase
MSRLLIPFFFTAAARSLVALEGFYINNRTIDDPQFKVMTSDLVDGRVAIFRAGKNKLVIFLTDSREVEGIEAS